MINSLVISCVEYLPQIIESLICIFYIIINNTVILIVATIKYRLIGIDIVLYYYIYSFMGNILKLKLFIIINT